MLIKDPYLGSEIKHRSFSTVQPQNVGQASQKQSIQRKAYLSQPYKKIDIENDKKTMQIYSREMRSLSQAYRNQEQALKKISSLNLVNKQYNQAMKQRNYELNTKLNDLTYQKVFLTKRHQEELLKNTYNKDLILRKYEQQNDEIIRLKRANAEFIEQKTRLEEEVQRLLFLMEKDSQQGSLQVKQQIIRMENMERTLRNIIDTKDAEIVQLRHRMKAYEDENRRLNDLNKTLTITRQQFAKQQQKLQNISNISHVDSNIKSQNKQNVNINKHDDYLISELNQQKEVNKQLLSQINIMKKKLFEDNEKQANNIEKIEDKKHVEFVETIQQKIDRHNQIRQRINTKIYEIYCNSIKQGQKQKRNSLLLFIQNYKKSHLKQSLNQINQYLTLRQELKQIHKISPKQSIKVKLQKELPMKLASRSHTKDSDWVLSTMQLAKNQKTQAQGKNQSEEENNTILFLFRLLTIQFRTKNPLQGKVYDLDPDVENQLLHSIVKATQQLIQIS